MSTREASPVNYDVEPEWLRWQVDMEAAMNSSSPTLVGESPLDHDDFQTVVRLLHPFNLDDGKLDGDELRRFWGDAAYSALAHARARYQDYEIRDLVIYRVNEQIKALEGEGAVLSDAGAQAQYATHIERWRTFLGPEYPQTQNPSPLDQALASFFPAWVPHVAYS
jgi:hypothetical protein